MTSLRPIPWLLLLAVTAQGAVDPLSLARHKTSTLYDGGIFEGGTAVRADWDGLRVTPDTGDGTERWTFDFSKTLPRLQLRYEKAETFRRDDDTEVTSKHARFVLLFRQVGKNLVSKSALARISKDSRFVKEAVLYPPIENGDFVVELILKKDVLFAPYQPIEKDERLVLDLK